MMRLLFFRSAAIALVAALAVPAAAQNDVSPAKRLPPTVYAYVAAPDVQTLTQRVENSSLGALLRDPQLQPALQQVQDALAEAGGQVRENLGVSLEELRRVPSGEVAFAICDVPGESVGMVLILNYGGNGATVDTLVEKGQAEMERQGARRSTENFEGTEIVVYTREARDAQNDDLDLDDEPAPTAGAPSTTAWFRKDNRLVLGNGTAVLEAVLARWDGRHSNTFADNRVFDTISRKTRTDDRDPVVVWYLDPIGGLQTALGRIQGAPPQLQMAAAFLPTIGITQLKAIGGSVDVATREFDSVTKTFFYVERAAGGNLGLLGLFQFSPAELAPPDWVTESAAGYFGANWDVAGAIRSVRTLVDTFQGPGAFDQLMQRAAAAPQGPRIHPQRDFLDQLTGRIHMVSYPAEQRENVEEAAVQQQPAVIAIGVKDEQRMNDVLARLANTPNFPGESRQFQGATIYELPIQTPGGGEPGTMAIAVAKGHLLFGTEVSRLEEVLRETNGTPLSQTEEYKKVAAHFPNQTAMIGYQDQSDQLRAVYEALRSGRNEQLAAQFDFSALPPFDDIAEYFRSTGSYAVADEDGAILVNFSLKLDR